MPQSRTAIPAQEIDSLLRQVGTIRSAVLSSSSPADRAWTIRLIDQLIGSLAEAFSAGKPESQLEGAAADVVRLRRLSGRAAKRADRRVLAHGYHHPRATAAMAAHRVRWDAYQSALGYFENICDGMIWPRESGGKGILG